MRKISIILLLLVLLLSFALISCDGFSKDSEIDIIIRPNNTDTSSNSQNNSTIIDSNLNEEATSTNTDLNTDTEFAPNINTETSSDGEDLKPDIPSVITVSFDSDGNDAFESIELIVGLEYTLPTPTKSDYIFEGWYYNEQLIPLNGIWSISNNVELVARWTKQTNTYTISYDFNGGKADNGNYPQVYNMETDKLQIGIPKREGNYKFIGWQSGDIIEYYYKINAGSYGDISLKAMWYEYEYTYQDENGIQYLLKDDNTLSVVGYVGELGNINIPYMYNNHMVTEIGSYAFCGYGDALAASSSSSSFYRCDIPDTVTKICIGAFEACDDLKVQLSYYSEISAEEWSNNLIIEERNDHVYDVINGKRPAIGWNKYWIPGT